MKPKSLILIVGFFNSLLFFASCSSNSSSKQAADSQNEQNMATANTKNNAQLVVNLVAAQYDEINLSKYALNKSTNGNLKDIAKMMITDHTGFLNGLTSLAAKKNITVPNEDSTEVNKKINSWKGEKEVDFNKDWTASMVSAHKDAIDKIQKALDNTGTDPDIKELLNATLPTVKKHLDMLNQLNDKLTKMKS